MSKPHPEPGWTGSSGTILTFSNVVFPVFEAMENLDKILVEDIAHALSNTCRFTGHVRKFYSVAEHCCMCSDYVLRELSGTAADGFHALMHDSSEAYLVDLPRPIKHSDGFGSYRRVERKLDRAIVRRFGLDGDQSIVKIADLVMLVTEKRELMPVNPNKSLPWPEGIEPWARGVSCWTPGRSEREFLRRFRALDRARSNG